MGHFLGSLNADAIAVEQANLERANALPAVALPPQVMRISPSVMRIAGEQLQIRPASHTMGIGAANVWMVSRLRDGRVAVGSFGQGLLTAEEVAEAIKQFQAMPHVWWAKATQMITPAPPR